MKLHRMELSGIQKQYAEYQDRYKNNYNSLSSSDIRLWEMIGGLLDHIKALEDEHVKE